MALVDLQRLVMEDRFKRLYESLGIELKAEITRRLEHDEDAEVPDDKPKTSKDDLLRRVDETISDAEFDGDISAKLKGIELLAKLEQLLSNKIQQDPTITINVITGVPRG